MFENSIFQIRNSTKEDKCFTKENQYFISISKVVVLIIDIFSLCE